MMANNNCKRRGREGGKGKERERERVREGEGESGRCAVNRFY